MDRWTARPGRDREEEAGDRLGVAPSHPGWVSVHHAPTDRVHCGLATLPNRAASTVWAVTDLGSQELSQDFANSRVPTSRL
jgi:hypothetical protein